LRHKSYIDQTVTEERDKRGDLRVLGRLYGFLRPYWLRIAGAGISLMVAAGTVLALGQGLRALVDEGFRGGDESLLDSALFVLLLVILLLAGATYGRFYLVSWVGERVVADIRTAVFNHVSTLSAEFFDTTRTGEVLSRLTTDTTLLQLVIGSSVSIALRNFLLFCGGATMLFITSPKLTGLVFLCVPLVIAPLVLFGRRVRRFSRASQDKVADISAYADEALSAVETMQAFTHESVDRARFASRTQSAFDMSIQRVRARAVMTVIVIVLVFGAIGVVLWIGGHEVIAGTMTPGDLSAFVFYAVVVAGSVGALSEVVGDLQRAAGATERLFELMARRPDVIAPDQPTVLPTPAKGAVRFDNVSFSYPSRLGISALNNIDLTILPGETVALVGPSGAGKSTMFQLLLRFYDPAGGVLEFDGVDLRSVDPTALRHRIGIVAQDPVVFSDSAMENIRYGRPEASDDEVYAAATAAAASAFIEELPDGYQSPLGERGARLSGGQRQRIAIARAILRDPAVLLLDEATSALDAESERLVQQALESLMKDRTTIVIAHRLATVLKADRIIVMEEGRIVAEGDHHTLVSAGGLYARLVKLQFDQGQSLQTVAPSDDQR
jgi:ATP-binding cassette, subfamily B, bacterial